MTTELDPDPVLPGPAMPDPAMTGDLPEAPLVLLPAPVVLFHHRAERFALLAESRNPGPYLSFLADLSGLQARLAATLPPVTGITEERLALARSGGMAPLDRGALVTDPELDATFDALCAGAAELTMPEVARLVLSAVTAASEKDRHWLFGNVLADGFSAESAAPHLFVAAAVQIHLARLAATLDAAALVPVGIGICPACGGRPVTALVRSLQGGENIRYACCAGCATQWKESGTKESGRDGARIQCLCCGSTRGGAYRAAESHEAAVKAETCTECGQWVKVFFPVRDPDLDPVADDVGSLDLDQLMKEAGLRRGGFNPYLVGY